MKKGQVVKFVEYGGDDSGHVFTPGKEYVVCSGEGDTDQFGDYVRSECSCEVMDDVGDVAFVYLPDSSHGVWEWNP